MKGGLYDVNEARAPSSFFPADNSRADQIGLPCFLFIRFFTLHGPIQAKH